jgi:hypothetical protein
MGIRIRGIFLIGGLKDHGQSLVVHKKTFFLLVMVIFHVYSKQWIKLPIQGWVYPTILLNWQNQGRKGV